MATELTTPIDYGTQATTQRVEYIEIDLRDNKIRIHIANKDTNTDIIAYDPHEFDIWDENGDLAIPASISTEAKDLHDAITASAKAQGWIGPGTTTSDLVDQT